MFSYLIKKLTAALGVILGVITIVFILFFVVLPADPARLTTGQRSDAKTVAAIRKDLYLDKPLPLQFALYLNDLSPISWHDTSTATQEKYEFITQTKIGANCLALKAPYLRRSYQTKKNVGAMLIDAFPGTLILATLSIIIAAILGILLGVFSAINRGTWKDTTTIMGSVLGISAPSFFAGILMAYIFGFVCSKYTGLQIISPLWDYTPGVGRTLQLKSLILPVITLAIRPMAIITQITRSSMLDVLGQDFIRTAYAKGLNVKAVLFSHALCNALNPIVTSISGWFAELLAGSFFIEYIFGWKGLGKITVDALNKFDFPVLMGSVLFSSLIFIVINILLEVVYKVIDPRIK
jgi:peptide/nickel transport system permease protein